MKQRVNRFNMKIVSHEPEKCRMKNFLTIKFSSSTICFIQRSMNFLFLLFLHQIKPIQCLIQHGIFVMLEEMLHRFIKALCYQQLVIISVLIAGYQFSLDNYKILFNNNISFQNVFRCFSSRNLLRTFQCYRLHFVLIV